MYQNFSRIYDKFMEYCDYEKWSNLVYSIGAKHNITSGELLDIGCGTGSELKYLKEFFHCTGIDISENMIEKAKSKSELKECSFHVGDMRDFNLKKKFQIVTSLFDTINHLSSIEDLVLHFERVFKHLSQDGVYIFDTVDREFMNSMFKDGLFLDNREDFTVIWEHTLYRGVDYIDATYYIKSESGSTFERASESYEKKIFTKAEYKYVADLVGLEIIDIVPNSEVAGKREFYVLKIKSR